MNFYPNEVRRIMAADENGAFSAERAEAYDDFMADEVRIARGDGWSRAVNAIAASLKTEGVDEEIVARVIIHGHSRNPFVND